MKRWKQHLPILAVFLFAAIGFLATQYTQHQQWTRLREIQAALQEIQEQVDQIDREDSKALQKQLQELQTQIDSIGSSDEAEAPSVSSDKTVYVTPSGSSYHEKDCSFLANSETLWERTEAEAAGQGYTPCSRCNP
ncbi:MAG: hypothetical protein Q4F79_01445 [Eubacteriales bacterium]|nr:hypothetical protein [Eubacteriales bacterium]